MSVEVSLDFLRQGFKRDHQVRVFDPEMYADWNNLAVDPDLLRQAMSIIVLAGLIDP